MSSGSQDNQQIFLLDMNSEINSLQICDSDIQAAEL